MYLNQEVLDVILQVAPGTSLRDGIRNIIDGGRGALIVVGLNDTVKNMIDGGFYINCRYSSERVFELAKMDGAIIIDELFENIYFANVQLHPSRRLETTESGTRHRTAQRVAKQTGKLVIAISERRKSVTLYKGELKYKLRGVSVVVEQATQALKTLEKYRYVLDKELSRLTLLELEELVTMSEVASVMQRFEMIYRIKKELKAFSIELGTEGRLIDLQIKDLLLDLKEEKQAFIKDYFNYEKGELSIEEINRQLDELTDIELLELDKLPQILGHGKSHNSLYSKTSPKGYRALSKIRKLSKKDIEKLVEVYGDLNSIQESLDDELLEIKGISKFKIKAMRQEFKRIKNINQIGAGD